MDLYGYLFHPTGSENTSLQAWLAYELMKENGVQADVTLLHMLPLQMFQGENFGIAGRGTIFWHSQIGGLLFQDIDII